MFSMIRCYVVFGQIRRHLTGSAFTQLIGQSNLRKSTPADFRKLRELVCTLERFGTLGNDIELTNKEIEVNDVIMYLKMEEYNKGIADPSQFVPGYHIFERLGKIKESRLFFLLSKMPKGGALKAHSRSMCSTDFLIKLTYEKHLWVCTTDNGCRLRSFHFSQEKPTDTRIEGGEWQTMEQLRDYRGEENLNRHLQNAFSMYPMVEKTTSAAAWQHLMKISLLLDGLLRYPPVWGKYFYNALKEFYEDGAQYVEVRTRLKRFYCLDGTKLPVQETVKVYQEHVQRFKEDYPDFIDARIIYSPQRRATVEEVGKFVNMCIELNKEFPKFVVGFDLIGQEDVGDPLLNFAGELQRLPAHIGLYLHAGQTNWYGTHVDENLIDAVLLGTKRIGHAYAITKHPLVLQLVKKLDIAIEVCPVCSQVLQLGADYRNHPAACLIANDIPFVISSGNPSFWRTSPLSHDFYMAFLGIAPMYTDLKFLKRISKNSIKYSSLPDEEKALAMTKWKIKWEKWVDIILKTKDQILAKETDTCPTDA
ncbi:adenosine deaminase 2-A [Drosophila virilis]|uniref:Adenosine deaminase n=1 Tax=Drosophila virilis TaxID=7244 RepID=B4LIZ9_DROVI|nr:adenosine deaminase 2-A [Drosophila virilis]EDW60449.2 uncharacterized protein Dvir_GJ21491 [Drosophila virilis]